MRQQLAPDTSLDRSTWIILATLLLIGFLVVTGFYAITATQQIQLPTGNQSIPTR